MNVNAKLGKVYLKDSPYGSDSVVIIIGLTGKIRGQVIFTMNKKVAIIIASKMMCSNIAELDEMAKSAVSELTNMILGNTATIFYNKGIRVEITPPSLLMGENMQISTNKVKTICIPLLLDDSNKFEIDVAIMDN